MTDHIPSGTKPTLTSNHPCNHRGFEAVTLRMQREMQGNPDPCPWCEIQRLRVALEAIEKAAVSTNDFWYLATAHKALHGDAAEPEKTVTKKCGLAGAGCNITIEHYHSWEQPPTELDLWVKVPHSVALTVGADNHALAEQIEQLTRERDEARRDCLNFKLQGNIAGLPAPLCSGCSYTGAPQGIPKQCTLPAGHDGPHRHAVKANACQCDPNPSIGGAPPCPVHDGESEE